MSFIERLFVRVHLGAFGLFVACSFTLAADAPAKESGGPVGTWKWVKKFDGGKEEAAPKK